MRINFSCLLIPSIGLLTYHRRRYSPITSKTEAVVFLPLLVLEQAPPNRFQIWKFASSCGRHNSTSQYTSFGQPFFPAIDQTTMLKCYICPLWCNWEAGKVQYDYWCYYLGVNNSVSKLNLYNIQWGPWVRFCQEVCGMNSFCLCIVIYSQLEFFLFHFIEV